MNRALIGLDGVHWADYAQPKWNALGDVPEALLALADATDLDRERAYHRMLYAIGNDHAGTYFPVVVPVIHFLGEILNGPALVARLRTLDVLIDLLGSFAPEAGHEEVDAVTGRCSLEALLRQAARSLLRDVERLHDEPSSDEEAELSGALLALLRE